MKKPLIIFLLLFIFISAKSQSDFRPGFIITNEGDSIAGQVDYRPNVKSYNSCLFKNSIGQVVEYFPNQLKSYGFIDDKNYTSEIEAGFFVEKLVVGTMSLYRMGEIYYVNKDSLYRLESEKEEFDELHRTVIQNKSRWRGILTYLISDCIEDPARRTRGMPFNEKNLTRLVISYNKCKGSNFQDFKATKAWSKTDFGAMIGSTYTMITVDDRTTFNEFDHLLDSYNSTDPFLGAVMSVSSPRVSERLAFQAEFQFIKSSFSGSNEVNFSNRTEFNDTFIDLFTLSIPLSIKYSLPEKEFGFHLLGGLNFDRHLKNDARLQTQSLNLLSSTVTTLPESAAFDIDKKQIGIWGGVGLSKTFKKIKANFNIRYFELVNNLNHSGIRNGSDGLTIRNRRVSIDLVLYRK